MGTVSVDAKNFIRIESLPLDAVVIFAMINQALPSGAAGLFALPCALHVPGFQTATFAVVA